MDTNALLAKIDKVKADFTAKLDEIAAAAQSEEAGEPPTEGEKPAEAGSPVSEMPMPEAGAEGAPAVVEEKKMIIGKKKPAGADFKKALGI